MSQKHAASEPRAFGARLSVVPPAAILFDGQIAATNAAAGAGASTPAASAVPLSSSQISTHDSDQPGTRHAEYSLEPEFTVTYAKNGQTVHLRHRMPGGKQRRGGGKRRPIMEFSKSSELALKRLVSSIDTGVVRAEQTVFVTLTYPRSFPGPRDAKRHLKAFAARFRRAWGPRAAFWRLEKQNRRPAPHFHLLIFMQSDVDVAALNRWVADAWTSIVDCQNAQHREWHLAFHLGLLDASEPCTQLIRDWHGVRLYAAKYMAKTGSAEGWGSPGRFWGVWNRELLPIKLLQRELTEKACWWLRRAIWGFLERVPTNEFRYQNARDDEHGQPVGHGKWRTIRFDDAGAAARFLGEWGDDFIIRPIRRKIRRQTLHGAHAFVAEATISKLVAHAIKLYPGAEPLRLVCALPPAVRPTQIVVHSPRSREDVEAWMSAGEPPTWPSRLLPLAYACRCGGARHDHENRACPLYDPDPPPPAPVEPPPLCPW